MKNLLLFIASVGAVLLLGCGEEDTESSPLKSESVQDNLLGEIKRLEVRNTPAAPQMPGIGSPTVTEVGYYRDLRLSKPITGTVEPGTTVYTKVVFSEPMRHIASDEKDTRPILSFVIDGRAVRYRMKQRGTSGKNLQSGDSKPRNKKKDQFLCKYTVQADDEGPFTLKVGKSSTDTDGNKLAKTYVHDTVLQLGQQMPPEVTEVGYYRDLRLSKPITGTVEPGTTVYTKVVFSEPMRHIASDEKDARPILSFVIDGRTVRYRMKQRGTSGKNLQSGDSKPRNKKKDQFLCKYTVQADDEGPFTLKVGKSSTDTDGNKLAKTYVHNTELQLTRSVKLAVNEEPEGQQTEKSETNQLEKYPHLMSLTLPTDLDDATELQKTAAFLIRGRFVGNSPLERAVRIAERIRKEYEKRLISESLPPYLGPSLFYSYVFNLTIDDVFSAENVTIKRDTRITVSDGDHFLEHLPYLYFTITDPDDLDRTYRYDYTLYWIVVEYLRLSFERPDADIRTMLSLFRESVLRGRISIEFSSD